MSQGAGSHWELQPLSLGEALLQEDYLKTGTTQRAVFF